MSRPLMKKLYEIHGNAAKFMALSIRSALQPSVYFAGSSNRIWVWQLWRRWRTVIVASMSPAMWIYWVTYCLIITDLNWQFVRYWAFNNPVFAVLNIPALCSSIRVLDRTRAAITAKSRCVAKIGRYFPKVRLQKNQKQGFKYHARALPEQHIHL